jgi:hypothetical protein
MRLAIENMPILPAQAGLRPERSDPAFTHDRANRMAKGGLFVHWQIVLAESRQLVQLIQYLANLRKNLFSKHAVHPAPNSAMQSRTRLKNP